MTSNWENRTHMSTQTFEPKASPSADLVQIGSIEDVIQQLPREFQDLWQRPI